MNTMRIILWNCNNGISSKEQIDYFNSFDPDLAIIPELKQHNIEALKPSVSCWTTNNHTNPSPKGLGILAFNGIEIEELPRDEEMEIFIPIRVKVDGFIFILLAVWNFYSACKQGRFKGLLGDDALEYSALRHYSSILNDPCLVAGDWNQGPTFAVDDYLKISKILSDQDIHSLYHRFRNVPITNGDQKTFRHSRGKLHALDHMFGSRFFVNNIKNFYVDSFENVIRSDHAPMVLDIKT